MHEEHLFGDIRGPTRGNLIAYTNEHATGGEPLGQKSCIGLLEALLKKDYIVSLETNGSFSIAHVPSDVIKVIDLKNDFAWV